MSSLERPRLTRTQQKALLALIGLAFVIIAAGIGLMQAFYSAHGILDTQGVSGSDAAIIARQAITLFPSGYVLLLVGTAIVVSVILQPIFYLKWLKPVGRKDWWWAAGLVGVTIVGATYLIWSRWFTFEQLGRDYLAHGSAILILLLLSLWGMFFLRKALLSLERLG